MKNLYVKIVHMGEDYWTIECNGKEYEVSEKVGRLVKLMLLSIRSVLTK